MCRRRTPRPQTCHTRGRAGCLMLVEVLARLVLATPMAGIRTSGGAGRPDPWQPPPPKPPLPNRGEAWRQGPLLPAATLLPWPGAAQAQPRSRPELMAVSLAVEADGIARRRPLPCQEFRMTLRPCPWPYNLLLSMLVISIRWRGVMLFWQGQRDWPTEPSPDSAALHRRLWELTEDHASKPSTPENFTVLSGGPPCWC